MFHLLCRKPEARNPKFKTKLKLESRISKQRFRIFAFLFRVYFGFRDSDFAA